MANTTWYLLTDAFTNESLARELAREGITEEEAAARVFWRGKEVLVWRVPFRFARRMNESRNTFPFRFTILVQEGAGEVRRWNLQGRGKIARSKPMRKAQRDLVQKSRR